jgi:hypothetical protein
MKLTYVSLFVIALVLTSGIPFFSGSGVINNASARYAPANTQTEANANECNTGTNCAINSPQTQGDGSANSPTNLQISNFNEEEEQVGVTPPNSPLPKGVVVLDLSNCKVRLLGELDCAYVVRGSTAEGGILCFQNPDGSYGQRCTVIVINPFASRGAVCSEFRIPPIPTTITCAVDIDPNAHLLVKKNVICPTGFVCPTADQFTLRVEAQGAVVNPATFSGSETGTEVGFFISGPAVTPTVTEIFPTPLPSGLNVLTVSQDMGCLELIAPGESKTCTITNEYRVR